MRPFRGLLAVALASALALLAEAQPRRTMPLIIRGHLFELELATTPAARERGLMFRSSIEPSGGMIFAFPQESVLGFWMKNTLADLDIVYLDAGGRVVSWAEMRVEPPRGDGEAETDYEIRLPVYRSKGPARYAIEFRAGTLNLLQLTQGETIGLDITALERLAR